MTTHNPRGTRHVVLSATHTVIRRHSFPLMHQRPVGLDQTITNMVVIGWLELTSSSSAILASTGDTGRFPSSPAGACSFLRAFSSSGMVRVRLHCHPRKPVHKVEANRMAMVAGWIRLTRVPFVRCSPAATTNMELLADWSR